jgi:hypothetical protein
MDMSRCSRPIHDCVIQVRLCKGRNPSRVLGAPNDPASARVEKLLDEFERATSTEQTKGHQGMTPDDEENFAGSVKRAVMIPSRASATSPRPPSAPSAIGASAVEAVSKVATGTIEDVKAVAKKPFEWSD